MSLVDAAVGTLGAAILAVPGWWCARKLQVPSPWFGGFLLSAVGLFQLILVLTLTGAGWSRYTLLGGWLTAVLVAIVMLRRIRPVCVSPPAPAEALPFWMWLPLLPALGVIGYRAFAQPLFGVDTAFRWNFLAEQMVARGSLAFYPPVTAADYEIYAWPDAIAPLVAGLYCFQYLFAGATRPELTAPLVLLQGGLLLAGTYALARKTFSARAGVFATALVAATPVVLWSVAMGQETGLLALGVIGLLLYLPASAADATGSAVLLAGLAAALASLAREYGVIVPAIGLLLGLARGLPARMLLLYAAVVLAATAPWYARNWALTGNPLGSLPLGGLFPTNEVYAWLNASYAEQFGSFRWPAEAGRLILSNAIAGILALALGLVAFRFRHPALLVVVAAFAALWVWSISYTAAGFMYALRVLTPGLAVAAVLGGGALARWLPDRRNVAAVTLGLTLFAGDAALRTLTLPANVYRVPPSAWFEAGNAIRAYHDRPVYRQLSEFAGKSRILVLGPTALLSRHGARTVPLWSPEVRFLFEPGSIPQAVAARLAAANIGFVVLNSGEVNARFLTRSPFFQSGEKHLKPLWADGDMTLFRISTG